MFEAMKAPAVIAVLTLLQVTFLDILNIEGIKPNLCIIGVIYFALSRGRRFAFLLGGASGFLYGLFTLLPFPIHIVSFATSGYLASCLSQKIYKDRFTWHVLAGFIFAALVLLFDYLSSAAFFGMRPFLHFSLSALLPISAYTAAVSPFAFLALRRGHI